MPVFEDMEFFTPSKNSKDPVVNRRNTFVKNLREQIRSLEGNGPKSLRNWYDEVSDGIIATIRFANKPIKVNGGTHFKVKTKEKLMGIYEKVITEAENREWDDILTQHADSMKKPTKKAA
jgi:hypothetical protein